MKFLFFASVLAMGFSATAMPSVGDMADYDITRVAEGQTLNANMKAEITAYDQVSDAYTINVKMSVDGRVQNQTEKIRGNKLPSESQIQGLIDHCQEKGGTLEKVTTSAGSFDTCALQTQDEDGSGTSWIGVVPFGLVKRESRGQNGETLTLVLKDLKKGN